MFTSLQFFLLIHLTAFALLGGTLLTTYLISLQCWKYVEVNKQKALAINAATLALGRATAIGGALAVISGILMLVALHGAVLSQLWFRIKMLIVVLIILNQAIVARKQSLKLQALLTAQTEIKTIDANTIRLKLRQYYFVQFILLLTILVLSVFKFT